MPDREREGVPEHILGTRKMRVCAAERREREEELFLFVEYNKYLCLTGG